MNGKPRTDEAPALLAGRLEGVSLPDLLWKLCRERKTGILHLTSSQLKKSVFIKEGRIVFASSSDPDDRLGELLLRQGTVKLHRLEEALLRLHTGKRLGTLLVEMGSLTPEELVRGVLAQVEAIVLSLFTWEEGVYRFDAGPLPGDEVITLGMRTPEILLRGIRRIRSLNRIRRSVGSPHQWYGLAPGWREILEGLTLTVGEELLIERLRDGDVSVEDLCNEVFLSNFEIYQTLWGFRMLGVILEQESRSEVQVEATQEGSLRQAGFDELLVRLGRERETGVLYISGQNLERTFHIKEGRCVFATSNEPEDSLLAFLLRRGVISLRDREETAKRLLSNKRVGTILRELGVIDEQDLREMVRQQISEIVYDTFSWTDAHFAFVAGPLPSNEEITLEESLDRLVAEGLRRVTSWTRVIRGCGGLEHRLALQPAYLDVLDAMSAGRDEWSVIASLKQPQTPREICRTTELGSFRVCQILWGLRVLGAVAVLQPGEEAAAGASAEEVPVEPTDVRRIDVVELDEEPQAMDEQASAVALPVEAAEPTADEPAEEEVLALPEAEPQDETTELPPPALTPLDATQAIPSEVIKASLCPAKRAGAETEVPVDATQARFRQVIDASTSGLDESDMTQVISPDVVEESLRREGRRMEEGMPPGAAVPDRGGEARVFSIQPARAPSPESDLDPVLPEDLPEHGGSGATQVISRDVIDDALAKGSGGESGEESDTEPEFEPSADLQRSISRFNTIQRMVYRAVRTEVGAGAVNFIRSCCGQLGPDASGSLRGAEIRADGSWDAEGLRRAAVQRRIEDPWPDYEALIRIEIELLREHLGETQIVELQRRMEQVGSSESAER